MGRGALSPSQLHGDRRTAQTRGGRRAGQAAQVGRPCTFGNLPRASACDVLAASYGGSVAVLIRSEAGTTVNYTVLQVDGGFEQSQTDAFLRMYMPNGKTIARYTSRERAVARAFELCPAPS